MSDVLPSCHTREIRGRVFRGSQAWIACYCMSCGKQHGMMPEPEPGSGYVGYLCDDGCAQRYSDEAGMRLVPDEVVMRKAREEMFGRFGRMLTPIEIAQQIDDSTTPLAALVRDAERNARRG